MHPSEKAAHRCIAIETAQGFTSPKRDGARFVRECPRGDHLAARGDAVIALLPLVDRLVRAWSASRPGMRDDLAQEAVIGAMRAVDTWQPGRGPLKAHAARWAKAYMQRYVDSHGQVVRAGPVDMQRVYRRARALAAQGLSLEAIVDRTGMDSAGVTAALSSAASVTYRPGRYAAIGATAEDLIDLRRGQQPVDGRRHKVRSRRGKHRVPALVGKAQNPPGRRSAG